MEMNIFEMTQGAVFVQFRHIKTKELLEDEKGPVGVEVYSADSEQFKKHRRRVQDMALEAQTKRRGKHITAKELDDETEQTLAACIARIVNVSWHGKELKAPEDSLQLIKVMPWAAEQIDEAMADRTRFMPALSKT